VARLARSPIRRIIGSDPKFFSDFDDLLRVHAGSADLPGPSCDAALPLVTKRATQVSYVIAPNGRIVHEYTSLSPDEQVKNTLGAVKRWAAEHPRQ